VLIIEDFKSQEFYGSEIEISIQSFLRPEAKFGEFGEINRRVHPRNVQ